MDNNRDRSGASEVGLGSGVHNLMPGDDPTLLEYSLILRPWLRSILITAVVSAVVVFLLAKFAMTQWYLATAVIRPASQQGPVSPLASVVGSMSAGSALSSLLSSSAGFGETIPSDAAQYIDLTQGYHFTMALIEQHKLGPMLEKVSLASRIIGAIKWPAHRIEQLFAKPGPPGQHWGWYSGMQKRFNIEYDDSLGSITLTFKARDPATAKAVLGYYIDGLREALRTRNIKDTEAVISSLKSELDQTSDPLVQQQLAAVIAVEIEQEKTAEAQADFAFSVTDAPYVPPEIYSPKAALWAFAAGVIVPFMLCVWLIFIARIYSPLRAAQARLGARAPSRAVHAATPTDISEEPPPRRVSKVL